MRRLSLKAKILMLLIAGLSSIGVNLGGRTAKADACGHCVQIWQNGHLVGFGCVSGGQGVCTSGSNYCNISYTQRCS